MEMERLPLGQSLADKHRAAELRWRGMPPGIPPDLAIEFMAKLTEGSTIRKLTGGGKKLGPALVSAERFKKHCELNPIWAAEAWRISKLNTRAGKISRFRSMTHCKYGHPLSDASFYQKEGYVARHCRICRTNRAKRPAVITPESGERVRVLLRAKAPISSFTKAGTRGYVMNHVTFTHFRTVDPEIELLAARVISGAQARAQKLRWTRVHSATVRDDNNEYYKIRGMIPEGNPHRDDIVARIFEDILSGALHRQEVPSRVKVYVTEFNRLFPTKYAKFGNSPLLSLDEVSFEDGTTTRGANAFRSLWD